MTKTIEETGAVVRRRALPRPQYILTETPEGGGQLYVLKPAGLALIKRMSTQGRDLASIAAALGTSIDTFREIRKRNPEAQEAVDQGRAALGDELVDILLEQARNGVTVAAIFLAKARCGWREGEGMEGKVVNNTQINIQIPESMPAAEFKAIVDGRPDREADEAQQVTDKIAAATAIVRRA